MATDDFHYQSNFRLYEKLSVRAFIRTGRKYIFFYLRPSVASYFFLQSNLAYSVEIAQKKSNDDFAEMVSSSFLFSIVKVYSSKIEVGILFQI